MGLRTVYPYNVGPVTIAKLVNITPITMIYGTYKYTIHGVYKATFTSRGGPTLYFQRIIARIPIFR